MTPPRAKGRRAGASPAPSRSSSPAGKGARTRQAIIRAATSRFVADGFQRTSMADVARDVGLSASAVYRYFPTKEALFVAAVDADTAGTVDLVRTTIAHSRATTVAELLADVRSELVAAVCEHPLAARALTGVEPIRPDQILALPHLAELRGEMTDLLQAGQEIGAVRADVAADTLALGIETIVMYHLAHLASRSRAAAEAADARWEAISAVIQAALVPSQPA